MNKLLPFLLILTSFTGLLSCEKKGGYVSRLSAAEKSKFPQSYYTLDTLNVVYKYPSGHDTVLLIGGEVDEFVVFENEYQGDPVLPYEVLRKQFKSPTSPYRLIVSASKMPDEGFPSGGGILIDWTLPVIGVARCAVRFSEIASTPGLQIIETDKFDYRDEADTITYDISSGIKKIKVNSIGSYTLEMY